MLWRTRRRALTVAHFICCLGLVPGYLLIIWSAGDGSFVLLRLGIHSGVPAVSISDAPFIVMFLGVNTALIQAYRLMFDMRERAIAGDMDAIPPAKPLPASPPTPLSLPITLAWKRSRRSSMTLLIWLLVSCAAYGWVVILIGQAGLFSYLFSLQGGDFWELAAVVVMSAGLCALLPLTLLLLLTRGPSGVVADAFGVSAWRKHDARDTIAWADARLLEVNGVSRSRDTRRYSFYAADGRSLTWWSRAEGACRSPTHLLLQSNTNDSEQRAAGILELAYAHARLTPRTFDEPVADRSSNLAAPGNLLGGKDAIAGLNSGGVTLVLGTTAGCAVAALASRSPFGVALPLVGAVLVNVSTLWSLAALLSRALSKPTRLAPDRRPHWQVARSLSDAQPVEVAQTRSARKNWALGIRGALLFFGCAANVVNIISALLVGHAGPDAFANWYSLILLLLALCFAALRVVAQFKRERVRLVADAEGLRNLLAPAEPAMPWSSLTSLRFTWSRTQGFIYTVEGQRGVSYVWVSGSHEWHDDMTHNALDADATRVGGETFAAIVTARTGLVPAQAL